MLVMFFFLQAKQMKKLYMKIKNDRYLIGQRLQNYERKSNQQAVAWNIIMHFWFEDGFSHFDCSTGSCCYDVWGRWIIPICQQHIIQNHKF